MRYGVTGRLAAVFVVGWIASGCGDDGETADGGSPPTGASACAEACASCDGDPCADCATAADRYRDEYEAALFSCVSAASSCDASVWIGCSSDAASQASRRPIDDAYQDACLAKRADCEAEGSSFADDDCLLSHLLSEAWVAKAEECLDKSCAETESCLGEIFN